MSATICCTNGSMRRAIPKLSTVWRGLVFSDAPARFSVEPFIFHLPLLVVRFLYLHHTSELKTSCLRRKEKQKMMKGCSANTNEKSPSSLVFRGLPDRHFP